MGNDNKTPSLGIGIPTYNRSDALCRRLDEISELSSFIDNLVVCDNSEVTPDVVHEKIRELPMHCTYVKNQCNIGCGANFIRVLEHSATDYLWWRGDDDAISKEQVLKVRSYLTSKPRLVLLNPDIKEPFIASGIDSFVDNFKLINSMGWLSSIVLPISIAQKSLRWGYWGIPSGWAHVTLILGLFREYPALEFCVVPFELKETEFRDVGRERGLPWAFFTTCVKQFPQTASILESPTLKRRYLDNWRLTQGYYLISKIFRTRLGFTAQEHITASTFAPLLSLKNPKTTLLFFILYTMSKIPRIIYQVFFPFVWFRLCNEKKKTFGLDFLLSCKSYSDVFKSLQSSKYEYKSDKFY